VLNPANPPPMITAFSSIDSPEHIFSACPRPGDCDSVACKDDPTRLCQVPHRCFVLISICQVSRDGSPYHRRVSSPTPYLKPHECGRPRSSHHSPKLGVHALDPSTALSFTALCTEFSLSHPMSISTSPIWNRSLEVRLHSQGSLLRSNQISMSGTLEYAAHSRTSRWPAKTRPEP
jgi:hypothetical protein